MTLLKKNPRTYILPTKIGLLYGVALIFMLMVAFGYSNNLVFFVFSFLTSFGIVAMVFTNQNLKKFSLQNFSARPFFADETGEFVLYVLPNSNNDLINISFKYNGFQRLIEKIPTKIESSITLPIKSTDRGLHRFPVIQIESTYPFQLCRSWKTVCPLQEYLVYPSRSGSPHFPGESDGSNKNKLSSTNKSDEDFGGVKIYEKSDSPRRIDWKATARTREMQVKMFDSKEGQTLIFKWEQTQELASFEARVSQLALWIDLAEKSRFIYQLIVPGFESELSQGINHWQICLKSLALLDSSHVST